MLKKICVLATLLASFASSFAQTYLSSDIQKLDLVTLVIKEYYVDTVSESKLVEDAINGMLTKLDPHSVYIPKKEVQEMNEPLDGSFEGIGVQYQMMNDTLLVIQTISGGPSEKVGIMAGDRIISANDTVIAGVHMKTTDIQKRLRGPRNTKVVVKVIRRGVKDPIIFNITRDKIPIYSIDASYMAAPGVGYIKIDRFSATTMDEYKTAFEKLKKKGLKSLIIDLQGNGGGYLKTATDLADQFLDKNKMIVYTQGQNQPYWESLSTSEGDFRSGNLVVLVDESSASASEILSGALQDWDRAVIVGRRTFAKGLVQKPIPLPDGSMMRLTVARYYTPSGRCIQRPYDKGVENYKHDLIDRYNRGELLSEDSIAFPDSLRFKTKVLGRTVYGGGGIMPDVFVPIDTASYTVYHRNLVARGVINKFVLNYVDKNRKSLEAAYQPKDTDNTDKNFQKFRSEFVVTDADLKNLTEMGIAEKVELDSAQFEKSKEKICFQIKALVARDLWSTTEYYEIVNDQDKSYTKALELLADPKLYEQCLSKGAKKK